MQVLTYLQPALVQKLFCPLLFFLLESSSAPYLVVSMQNCHSKYWYFQVCLFSFSLLPLLSCFPTCVCSNHLNCCILILSILPFTFNSFLKFLLLFCLSLLLISHQSILLFSLSVSTHDSHPIHQCRCQHCFVNLNFCFLRHFSFVMKTVVMPCIYTLFY